MKRILVVILLIELGFANAGEMPRQMLFANLPDLAQQKLSVSFLNRSQHKNYWQFDVAFRQIFTYEEYFNRQAPYYLETFSPAGFHIFAGVGYKFIKPSTAVKLKVRYWQPMVNFKMAEEWQVLRVIRFVDGVRSSYDNRTYNQYYSAGFELNNGRLKQGKHLMTDMYWGFGFKINYLQYSIPNYQNYSPDFFNHATPIQNSNQWSFSPYLNLGIKFGKEL